MTNIGIAVSILVVHLYASSIIVTNPFFLVAKKTQELLASSISGSLRCWLRCTLCEQRSDWRQHQQVKQSTKNNFLMALLLANWKCIQSKQVMIKGFFPFGVLAVRKFNQKSTVMVLRPINFVPFPRRQRHHGRAFLALYHHHLLTMIIKSSRAVINGPTTCVKWIGNELWPLFRSSCFCLYLRSTTFSTNLQTGSWDQDKLIAAAANKTYFISVNLHSVQRPKELSLSSAFYFQKVMQKSMQMKPINCTYNYWWKWNERVLC